MPKTKVVHCKKSEHDVYIGRPSKWGNPFSHKTIPGVVTTETREDAVSSYRDWILEQPELINSLHELRGKTLGCWCKPQSCHGDVLAELADSINDPFYDGITHINIYSKGRTKLGQLLSNFHQTRIEMDGKIFSSVEAYWYWLLVDENNPRRDTLCGQWGWDAKKLGRELRAKDWPDKKLLPDFKKKISEALIKRVKWDGLLRQLLTESSLPLVHYYEYNGKVVVPEDNVGICSMWESVRSYLQAAQNEK